MEGRSDLLMLLVAVSKLGLDDRNLRLALRTLELRFEGHIFIGFALGNESAPLLLLRIIQSDQLL